MSLEDSVLTALGTVYDPELDEPITALGFIGACTVSDGGEVAVRLRLPTPQCAPNFAYLMASDAKDAVSAVAANAAPEVTTVGGSTVRVQTEKLSAVQTEAGKGELAKARAATDAVVAGLGMAVAAGYSWRRDRRP
mgnify:CR=1 FL=1